MSENYNKQKRYIQALLNVIHVEEPTEKVDDYIGLSRRELELKHPSHYIPHNATTGNLELTVDNGLVSCLIVDGICTEAYFISNDED